MSLGRLGGVFAALYAGHELADHIIQTNNQACDKAGNDWKARRACAAHVLAQTATKGAFLAAACAATGDRLEWRRVAAGLAVSGAAHYALDRRPVFQRLVRAVGKGGFLELDTVRSFGPDPYGPGTGAYAMDQALHITTEFLAALLITGGRRG